MVKHGCDAMDLGPLSRSLRIIDTRHEEDLTISYLIEFTEPVPANLRSTLLLDLEDMLCK